MALDNPQQIIDKSDVQASVAPATSLSVNLAQFAARGALAGTPSAATSALPDLTIASGSQHSPTPENQSGASAFVRGFAESLAYSAVQAPLEGIAQLVDHSAGLVLHTHLAEAVKDAVVAAPMPAAFGTAEWHGQSFGAVAGMLPWFAASRAGLRGGASILGLGEMLPTATSVGIKAVFEGGATGAIASVLKPVENSGSGGAVTAGAGKGEENYWAAKAENAAHDFVSFSTMTATSHYLNGKVGALAIESPLIARTANAAVGALSGVPAAFVDAGINIATGKTQNLSDLGKSLYNYSVIGGAFGVASGVSPRAFSDAALRPAVARVRDAGRTESAPGSGENTEAMETRPAKAADSLPIVEQKVESSADKIVRVADLQAQLPRVADAARSAAVLGGNMVGTLPEAFDSTGLSEAQNFRHLDNLANALKNLDAGLPGQKKSGAGAVDLRMPALNLTVGDTEVTVSKIGIGEVAHVYKVSVGGQDFALKIPNDRARADVHGAAFEAGAFVALSQEKISDLIDFHAAHLDTGGGAGWMMTEYVDRPVEREGTPLAQVLARQGLVLGDDWSANRGPGNVVWDLGGIEPAQGKRPITLAQLQEYLRTDEGKMVAGRNLGGISNQAELKAALLLCLEEPSLEGQVARTAVRGLKNQQDIHDVLKAALDTRGGAGRAAFELDRLKDTPLMSDLFYAALRNPESRVEAVKQISILAAGDRSSAFEAAFTYPEARAMAARSVGKIPEGAARDRALELVNSDPGATYAYLQGLSHKQSLDPEQQAQKAQALSAYLESHGLTPSDKALDNGPPVGASTQVSKFWPQLPANIKALAPEELGKAVDVFYMLPARQWSLIAPADLAATIDTIRDSLLDGQGARALVLHPAAAHWYQDNKASVEALGKQGAVQSSIVLHDWGEIPAAEKSLPAAELMQKAFDASLIRAVKTHFGEDSQTYKYLTGWSSESERTDALSGVRNLLTFVQTNSKMLARAKSYIAELAANGEPASTFADGQMLEARMQLHHSFSDDPAMEDRLVRSFNTTIDLHRAGFFVLEDHVSRTSLLNMVLDEGLDVPDREEFWNCLDVLASLEGKLELDADATRHLYRLMKTGLDLVKLTDFIDEHPEVEADVKEHIDERAGRSVLDARNLADKKHLELMKGGFGEDEQQALLALQKQGLSLGRVYNHLCVESSDWQPLKDMLARGAGVRDFNDFFSLAAYPLEARLPLLDAAASGALSLPNVLAKTRDWQGGKYFHKLLSEQAAAGLPLSRAALTELAAVARVKSQTDGAEGSALAVHRVEGREKTYEEHLADTFVDAVKGIEKSIPADKPIVLLGRDAWPLLPLLRHTGRDARYFMWSRLQEDDSATQSQWLKEVPPNAAVVDTGYHGSILDQIRAIDPTASGYMLSSRRGDLYPTLLEADNHESRVAGMEGFPKLIHRSTAHTAKGGAVARIKVDGEGDVEGEGWTRWAIQRSSQGVLRASGLPTWDVWRYSSFVGLTPQERLGLSNRAQLQSHYDTVAAQRNSN